MKQKLLALLSQFTWLDWFLVVIFLVSCVYLAYSGWSRLHQRIVPVEFLARNTETGQIWIDVEGAVVSPGVYQLASDARIKDALVAAGGVTGLADRDFLTRTINLAAKLKDGEKVYIPAVGETNLGLVKGQSSSQININNASEAELDSLPGIGAVRASGIIKNRPYQSIDELVTREVIPKNILEQIRSKISVY